MASLRDDELTEAEAAVRHCRALIERRRAEAERRERLGHDATQDRMLMRTFQRILAEHEACRDWLAADLRRSRAARQTPADRPGAPHSPA
jgi:uncharacterized protein YhaN